MRIQHNILAMNAYRNYSNNTSALGKNLERLSSGYKINRAGDDAAGLAISEKMRAQITGLDAAQKNVKDGISLVKTAEGAMQEIQDMLNRMAYLATQSANGTYDSAVDRTNLQKEVDALRDEINRIADSANFNGINLLDGTQAGTKGQAAWTETIEPVSVKGLDRILTGILKPDDESYVDNNSKTVLDSYVPNATKASFTIDLSQLKITAVNPQGSAGGSISGAQLGDITITIGGKDITIKGSQITSSISISASGAITGSITGKDLAEALLKSIGTKATVEINDVTWKVTADGSTGLKFEQINYPDKDHVTADFTVEVKYGGGSATNATLRLTGDMNPGTMNTKMGAPDEKSRGASTVFEMKQADFVDGAKLKLGDKTYTLRVGSDSTVAKGGTDVIDLSDLGDDFTIKQALTKIGEQVSQVEFTLGGVTATFSVGVTDKGISILRTDDISTPSKAVFNTLEKLAGFFSLSHGGSTINHAAITEDGGLTLQIGDTSEDHNQMTVHIGEMHTSKMGFDLDGKGNITKNGSSIADIDISDQKNAQEAIDVIKNAINYVSGVRGDLGAVQNRLEHTQNNLSVMAENIQDAESTIRDTDVAEEMMSYVKNNILVQSAQAMLAQANQVPQGVLQLLG